MVDRVDLERWRRLQAEVASRARAAIVLAGVDGGEVAHPIARTVPNGYRPVDGLEITGGPTDRPPTLVYVGGLRYRPNVEAVTRLATGVLPVVRRRHPRRGCGSSVTTAPRSPRWRPCPASRSSDTSTRCATSCSAHLTAVPMISGGGTRIKIIEAFAHPGRVLDRRR